MKKVLIPLFVTGLIFIATWSKAQVTNLYHFEREFVPVTNSSAPVSVYKIIMGADQLTGIIGPTNILIISNQTFATEYEGFAWGYDNHWAAWTSALAVHPQYFQIHSNVFYDNVGYIKGTREAYGTFGAYVWYLKNTIAFTSSASSVYVDASGVTSPIASVLVGTIGDFCPQTVVTDVGPLLNTNYLGDGVSTDYVARADVNAYYKLVPFAYLGVNNDDSDADGIPDFADGYDRDSGDGHDNVSSNDFFTPWKLMLSGYADPTQAQIRITYSASDPMGVSVTTNSYVATNGHFRLWRKQGFQSRAGTSILAGGDYIPSGTYAATSLGFSASSRLVDVFIEPVNPGTNQTLLVEVDSDGAGPKGFVCVDSLVADVLDLDVWLDVGCTIPLKDWPAKQNQARSSQWRLTSVDRITIRVRGPANLPDSNLFVRVFSESDTNGVKIILTETNAGTYKNTTNEQLALGDASYNGVATNKSILIVDEEILTFELYAPHGLQVVRKEILIDRAEFASCGIDVFYSSTIGDRTTVRDGALSNARFWDAGDGAYANSIGYAGNPMADFIKNAGNNQTNSYEADILHVSSHGDVDGNLYDDFSGIIFDPDATNGINTATDWNNDVEWVILASCSQLNATNGGRAAWETTMSGSPRRIHGLLGAYAPLNSDLRSHFAGFWSRLTNGETIVNSYVQAMEFDGASQPWAVVYYTENAADTLRYVTQDTGTNLTLSYLDVSNICGRSSACCDEPILETLDSNSVLVRCILPQAIDVPTTSIDMTRVSNVESATLMHLITNRMDINGQSLSPWENPLSTNTPETAAHMLTTCIDSLSDQLACDLRLLRSSPRKRSVKQDANWLTTTTGYLIEYEQYLHGLPIAGCGFKVSLNSDSPPIASSTIIIMDTPIVQVNRETESKHISSREALVLGLPVVRKKLELEASCEILEARMEWLLPDNKTEKSQDIKPAWHFVLKKIRKDSVAYPEYYDVWISSVTGQFMEGKLK